MLLTPPPEIDSWIKRRSLPVDFAHIHYTFFSILALLEWNQRKRNRRTKRKRWRGEKKARLRRRRKSDRVTDSSRYAVGVMTGRPCAKSKCRSCLRAQGIHVTSRAEGVALHYSVLRCAQWLAYPGLRRHLHTPPMRPHQTGVNLFCRVPRRATRRFGHPRYPLISKVIIIIFQSSVIACKF